jgi:predicted nuclease of restriction endonuclease-like (RecB) superfamily
MKSPLNTKRKRQSGVQNEIMQAEDRLCRGQSRSGVSLPVPSSHSGLPLDYAGLLKDLKQRIASERIRVVLAANSAMVLLYWDIGRSILQRQAEQGWGAKVIDRLSADLREAFPDMRGLSPRNLKYMRAFASVWADRSIVQRVIAQIPWRQNIALMEQLDEPATRLWYAEQTLAQGWSQPILCLQIENGLHIRQGKTVNNFAHTMPPEAT